ncbi:MAG: glycosyltransferase [Sediminibacterium sp.]|nr:glycosyltransferase [Sediminibacterium sp.]
MEKHLHIISFTVPYPADYGGVIDVFYSLAALQSQGVQIHLHCFQYGREEQPELEKYCASVQYYERHTGHKALSNTVPYIVSSRRNEQLLQTLLRDDHPILMEGVHCSWLLSDARFTNRKCFVRLHNAEFLYYRQLAAHTSSLPRKLYYWMESRLLRAYEKKIASKAVFWAMTDNDATIYREQLGCERIQRLPLFIPDWKVRPPEGMGTYCLYHGDLGVDANEEAVRWLLKKVFSQLKVSFVIAGKNPSEKLQQLVQATAQSCLVANPSEKEMQDLVAKAHIHVLPSYTTTGTKVKLLNVLFNGRHCVVNDATIAGSGLATCCHTGTTANAFREIIAQLYHQPFTAEETELRKRLLNGLFNNEANAKQQVKWIWG